MIVLKGLRKIFFGTYARGFFSSYLIVITLGAFVLSLPISLQSGVSLAPVDAMFTAASAISTTGLTTIVPAETFSLFGIIVLLLIIQFGGIGLIMVVALFWLIARRQIGFKQRNMIMTDQNQLSRQGIVRFVRNVLIMIFIIEGIAIVTLSSYLYFSGHFPIIGDAILQGVFLSISLFTNAGFDLAPNNDSFQMFANDYFMQSAAIFLIFMGGVGFWVLAEIKEFVVAKRHGERFKFSYFVKMLVAIHLVLFVVGAVLIIALEGRGFLADKSLIESIYYGLFMSITTRNAGFSTMDVNDFGVTTQLLMMVLMFIGASPNSAGGGIRTTTVLVVLAAMRTFSLGKQDVIIRERKIKDFTVRKSFVAIMTGVMLVFFAIALLSLVEVAPIHAVSFEVISAFGTTGLSLGITETLATFSKLVLVIVMFIARIGVLALLLMFRPDRGGETGVHYPETDIIVG